MTGEQVLLLGYLFLWVLGTALFHHFGWMGGFKAGVETGKRIARFGQDRPPGGSLTFPNRPIRPPSGPATWRSMDDLPMIDSASREQYSYDLAEILIP